MHKLFLVLSSLILPLASSAAHASFALLCADEAGTVVQVNGRNAVLRDESGVLRQIKDVDVWVRPNEQNQLTDVMLVGVRHIRAAELARMSCSYSWSPVEPEKPRPHARRAPRARTRQRCLGYGYGYGLPWRVCID